MNDSIAIIGVSFDLPNIKNWEDLKASLYDKNTYIGEMPKERLKEIELVFGDIEMAKSGYLSEIDKFDNTYFGFTERESLRLFPEHRLFLTNAIKAFYHAGYAEASLKGSKTGVFYTSSRSAYQNYANYSDLSFNSFDVIEGIEGTRLAKYLDLRGPVVSVNTTCSSSLVAVNSAIQSLNVNECDLAIVGGVKTLSLTKESVLNNVVHSKKETCRPFDQDADGIMNGEGAIFFVLKRYEQAIKDKDVILAEIKGAAVNHGGNRISSLTAPSSEAQKEVIIQAWKNANVDVDSIRYIEAHGTGTVLGDPIEVEAIKQAVFQFSPSRKNTPFAISSFKGQIGHLDYLSGLAGLLRVVAALHFEVIPVQSNFDKLNEYFDLEESGIYVPEITENWDSKNKVRIGGVSSFGLTGTNVHLVVLKNEIHNKIKIPDQQELKYLQISHDNHQKLRSYKDYLIDRIENINCNEDLYKLCSKLNKVFQLNIENEGIIYSSKDSLITSLKSKKTNSNDKKLFLLLDLDVLYYSKECIESIFIENLFIKEQWDQNVSLELNKIQNQYALNILFQFTIYKYIFNKLGVKVKLITSQEDSVINKLINSEISVREIIEKTSEEKELNNPFDENRFKKYLEQTSLVRNVVIIDFSNKNQSRFKNLKLDYIYGNLSNNDRFLLYTNMLESGVDSLKSGYTSVYNNIELPYFSPKRFWPEVKKSFLHTKDIVKSTSKKEGTNAKIFNKKEIKVILNKVWSSILEMNDFNDDEDFFELGGTSISALDMIDEIEKSIKGIKILYEEIYSYATVNKLTDLIYVQLENVSSSIKEQKNENHRIDESQINSIVKNSWVSILEFDNFSDDEDFFELGGTSLSALDMIDEIEKNIEGIKILYEEIYSYSTVSKLVKKIVFQLQKDKIITNLNNDKLDPILRKQKYENLLDNISKEEFSKYTPQNILITGATGLVGAAMVSYLHTNTKAKLYCIVQKKDFNSPEKRFWSIFQKHYDIVDTSRIQIIEGNLYLDNLGMKPNEKKINEIDTIFHIAGSPEFISKKTSEEHINYLGTKNIVDWSNKKGIKNFNFISTIGVVGKVMPYEVENFYETDINLGQDPGNYIHASSKLKAEEYIKNYYQFKSKVFRISNVGGRFEDGFFPTDLSKNLMWLKLKSLSELNYYYEELLKENSSISLFPVDILVKLIVEISFVNIKSISTFHIKTERSFLNHEIFKAFKKAGIQLELLSYEEFMSFMDNNHYKMNFYNVASEANKYKLRDDATNKVISKLNLSKFREFNKQLYLERLLSKNLKPNNQIIS